MARFQKEFAQVTMVSGKDVWLTPEATSGCGSCQTKQACGTGLLSQLLERESMTLRLPNSLGAKLGDRVVIGVPQSGLLVASILTYMVPILTLIITATMTTSFQWSEPLVILCSVVGLTLGWFLARWVAHRLKATASMSIQLLAIAEPNIKLQIE
ncbi:SoxR reducing system RseC family protein [Pleionea litopenaei]|uniref:SoxR reducing system RseC family protein n=1 Tax=Pleionea litopenaei TaxID=3070815 RepID=A0AA51RW06_9GAMM|nr:SoxR reducing system RseC family protein [Pleionea sp. HL-JVS1]WMS88590.1 SoxR reducing system RseC family protein [Pleionea sp. HL-JVS1]